MNRTTGFTLIELMVVVAIVAILAAVAFPAYNDYVTRSKLQEAYTNLSGLRVNMEQYYQDARMYSSTTAGGTCGVYAGSPASSFTGFNGPAVSTTVQAKYFTYTCASGGNTASGDQTYTITANGTANLAGFKFTIDQANNRATAGVGTGWTAPASTCWVLRKDGSC